MDNKYMSLDNLSLYHNNMKTYIHELLNELYLKEVYPIGSIYISVNSVSPSELFGGTWEQIKDVFLLSSGDIYTAGSVGGESEHALTVDEMPSHNHKVDSISISSSGAHTHVITTYYDKDAAEGTEKNRMRAGGTSSNTQVSEIASSSGKHTHTVPSHTTNNTGNSKPHNNMPPYLTVYMWKRIG